MPRGGVTDAAMPTILPARGRAPVREGTTRAVPTVRGGAASGAARAPLPPQPNRSRSTPRVRRRALQRLGLVDPDREVDAQAVGVVAHEVLVVGRDDHLVAGIEVAPAHAHGGDAVGERAHGADLGQRGLEPEQAVERIRRREAGRHVGAALEGAREVVGDDHPGEAPERRRGVGVELAERGGVRVEELGDPFLLDAHVPSSSMPPAPTVRRPRGPRTPPRRDLSSRSGPPLDATDCGGEERQRVGCR